MRRALNPLHYFFAALFLLPPFSSVFGWGPQGHEMVNQAAINKAPVGSRGFPSFFKSRENVASITFLALEPDRWRESGEPQLKAGESSTHYLDIELLVDGVEKK